MNSRQKDRNLADCLIRLAIGCQSNCFAFNYTNFLTKQIVYVKIKFMFLPGDIVNYYFVILSQITKLVQQIKEIVPVVNQKRLQVAEPTIFNDH